MEISLDNNDIESLIRRYYGDKVEVIFKTKNIKIILKTNTEDVLIRNTIRNEKTNLVKAADLSAPVNEPMGIGEESRTLIKLG